MEDLRWMRKGECAGSASDTHFPAERLRSDMDRAETREAKRQCGLCSQRERCLAYALVHQINYGIWGGLTTRERRRLAGKGRRKPQVLSAAS